MDRIRKEFTGLRIRFVPFETWSRIEVYNSRELVYQTAIEDEEILDNETVHVNMLMDMLDFLLRQ